MFAGYYQKNKERIQKKARERYQEEKQKKTRKKQKTSVWL